MENFLDFGNLKDVKPKTTNRKPIIVLHGDEKTGKTSFACQFENPLVIDLEDGLDGQNVARWPENSEDIANITTENIGALLMHLKTEKVPFKTLIIDSFSKLQEKVFDALCKKHGKSSIEAFGYGGGYKMSNEKFEIVMNLLRDIRNFQDMTIICICHSKDITIPAVDGNDYSVKGPDLYKDTVNTVKRYADLIGHVKIESLKTSNKVGGFGSEKTVTKVKGDKSTDRRVVDWGKNPAYVSGCRGVSLTETELNYESFNQAYQAALKTRQTN